MHKLGFFIDPTFYFIYLFILFISASYCHYSATDFQAPFPCSPQLQPLGNTQSWPRPPHLLLADVLDSLTTVINGWEISWSVHCPLFGKTFTVVCFTTIKKSALGNPSQSRLSLHLLIPIDKNKVNLR